MGEEGGNQKGWNGASTAQLDATSQIIFKKAANS